MSDQQLPPASRATLQQIMVAAGQVQNVAALQPQQQQLITGMMVVPSLSPTRGLPSSHLLGGQGIGTSHTQQAHLLIQQQQQQQQGDTHELQIVQPRTPPHATVNQPLALAFSSYSRVSSSGITAVTTASATGGTIHHLGQSPPRGTGVVVSAVTPPSLLVNPLQQQLSQHLSNSTMSGSLQQQEQHAGPLTGTPPKTLLGASTGGTPQRRSSMLVTGTSSSPGSQRPSVDDDTQPATPLVNSQNITASPLQSPERSRKRIKLEQKPPATAEIASYRKLICDERLKEMARLKENYREQLTELFFLQNGGNIMDYFAWKKRPTAHLVHFLKSGNLDSDDEDSEEKSINNEVKVLTTSGGTTPLATPVAISTTLPPSISAIQQQQDQSKRPGGRHGMVFGHVHQSPGQATSQIPGGTPLSTTAATTTVGSPPPYSTACSSVGTESNLVTTLATVTTASVTTTTATTATCTFGPLMTQELTVSTSVTSSPLPAGQLSSASDKGTKSSLPSPSTVLLSARQNEISSVYEGTLGSQEAIVERAKQEAQVMQRIGELRKEGMWSSRRLPKVQEPARNKAHWDYLLEEMQWLAADFAQERKWKKAGARKIARMVLRYHQEKEQKEVKAEKEESMKLKRIANNMAKMIKEFWSNIEKVVQYKQQSRLDEKRKKALDLHLSFIVDQTEKYSSWLTKGLGGTPSAVSSKMGSPSRSSVHSSGVEDGDFEPERSESDDEETKKKKVPTATLR